MCENLFDGVKKIDIQPAGDNRGSFLKIFNTAVLQDIDKNFHVAETYYSVSQKDVIRGMHFQIPPFECAKIVHVLSGAITDVLVDLRKNSPTFKKSFGIPLSAETPQFLYIPAGIAHGFRSLEDDTCMLYYVSAPYNRDMDTGIRWDTIDFNWNINDPILSQRDTQFVSLAEYESPF